MRREFEDMDEGLKWRKEEENMLSAYSSEEWIVIGITIIGGALIAIFLNFFWKNKKPPTLELKKENDKFVGKMNTTGLKKVIFSPEVCENEVPDVVTQSSDSDSETNSDEQEDEEENQQEDEEEEEEQMPQFNKRKIKNTHQKFDAEVPSTSNAQELSDADKMNVTIGKLHGKLATAQLKAKTRQIAAEMSEQEREIENQMTNNQMESIMKLMMQNQEKFGMSSEDIKEQMNLYKF
ncbi:unnamed protein product [Caenorhabditis nigoni]